MERYDDPTDAIPHELTVLVLNETNECFGRSPVDVFEDIRDEIRCDRLILEEHYWSLDDLPDYNTLVQYPIWVVHQSCLFVDQSTQLGSYLRTASFPDETQVLIVVDTDDERVASHLREEIDREYADEVLVVPSETALRYYFLGHLQVANPCSAAGLDYLVAWNHRISDTVGPR